MVKWGETGNPPTSGVENFIMVFLPRGRGHFSGSSRWTSGGFSNIWNHDPGGNSSYPTWGKGKASTQICLLLGDMQFPGRYLLRLFEMTFFSFSTGVFSIRNLPGCTKDGSWQICSIYTASVTRMCWMGSLTSFLCWCQAIRNSGWFHWMTYV